MILESLQREESAFTLIEVIIAVTILTTAGLAVMNLFANNTLLVGRTGQRNEALNEASDIIEEIKNIAVNLDNSNNFRTALQAEIEELYRDDNGPGFNSRGGNGDSRILEFDDGNSIELIDTDTDDLYRAIVTVAFAEDDKASLESLITTR